MSLIPCKECGTLNSSEAEICLSCEFPIKGRPISGWYKWVALGLALLIGLPFAVSTLQNVSSQIKPQTSPSQGK